MSERKPPTPVPCPSDAPKFTVPVCFSVTWKITSTSPASFADFVSGSGSGSSKKPRFEMFWIASARARPGGRRPRVKRGSHRGSRLVATESIVPDHVDPVDRGGLLFLQRPAEVHHGRAIRPLLAHDLGAEGHVDVAVVEVEALHVLDGILPLLLVEIGVALGRREGIVEIELARREPPVAGDLERSRCGSGPLHRCARRGSPSPSCRRRPRCRPAPGNRRSLATRRTPGAVGRGPPAARRRRTRPSKPPEAFGPGVHLGGEDLGAVVQVAVEVHLRDGDSGTFGDVEDEPHVRGVVA